MDGLATMPVSAVDNSPVHRINSASSEGDCESRSPVSVGAPGENERPERMRDWLIRMINSGRFIGLEWLDKDKTVFKVPWIHAKKRGYCRERDAALFREWAIHSGKYRQDSDPTVWKINFRCAINGLKDIQEIKDMQTEDCRVYKVYPSRSRRRRRAVRRTAVDPYPSCNTAYPEMNSHPIYSSYGMNPYGMSCGVNPVSSTDSLYSYTPNVKLEYPNMCMQSSQYSSSSLPSSIPASTNGIYSSIQSSIPTSCAKQSPYYSSDRVVPVSGVPSLPAKSSCMSITRMDSPDSGINVESQNSPSFMQQNSPVMQNSPLMQHQQQQQQQGSPLTIQQQHSPCSSTTSLSQIHSPPTNNTMQNHCSPLPPVHSQPTPSPDHAPIDQKPFSQPNNCSMGIASPSGMIPCHSPSMTNSPCPTVSSEPEDADMAHLLSNLEDNPTTPPISPLIPSSQLEVKVFYGSILVETKYVDCSKGSCRILSKQSYPCNTPEEKRFRGLANSQPVFLPENHPQALSKNIFDAMGSGIVLEVSDGSVYVTPLCRTIVYCSNSATPGQEANLLNKDQPTRVFDYMNHFRPALEHYALIQGQSPSPSFLLGLGQTWGRGRSISQNLVSIMVTHCKAKQDIDTISLPMLASQEVIDTIDIVNPPTESDLEADAFLKNLQEISN